MTREEILLSRYSGANSQAAFAEIMKRHRALVLAMSRRYLDDTALAEDVTQAVFLLLAQKAGSFRPGTVLTGWLFQTTRHVCLNARRAQIRRQHYERKAFPRMELTENIPDGLWTAIEPHLDEALASLGASERNALLLRYVEEMSLQEVAAALGITVSAAHKRISRALERLRAKTQSAISTSEGERTQPANVLTTAIIGALLTEQMTRVDAASLAGTVPEAATTARAVEMARLTLHSLRVIKVQAGLLALGSGLLLAGVGFALLHHRAVRPPATGAASTPMVTKNSPGLAGTIEGRLTFDSGAPAVGVRIGVQSTSDDYSGGGWTDADGRYRLTGLPSRRYNVAVDESSPALRGAWTAVAQNDLTVTAGAVLTGKDMVLRRGSIIAGKVLKATGQPASGVEVGVYGPAHPDSTPWVEATLSGGDGSFRLRVPPGHNYVYVMTTAEADRGVDVIVADHATIAANLTLSE